MKALKTPYEKLVLVCDNHRPPGALKPSCGDHGSAELRAWLKDELKQRGVWGRTVRVITTGCLDVCPKTCVVLSFDSGKTLKLANAETERAAILEQILQMCQDPGAEPA